MPLSFHQSPQPDSRQHSSRTNESIALHDAAVKSATSLMAVVNDMLQSPPVSAHLSTRHYSLGLSPMYGRPRSHTAPPTPLVEAPGMEPVELSASPLAEKPSQIPLHSPSYQVSQLIHPEVSIVRPHSSPQDRSYSLPSYTQQAEVPVLLSTEMLRRISGDAPTSEDGNLHGSRVKLQHTPIVERQSSESTRPSLAAAHSWPIAQWKAAGSVAGLSIASTTINPDELSVPVISNSPDEHAMQTDSQAALLEQIASMRASNEARITSLKKAHEEELASERTYIIFLESRKNAPLNTPVPRSNPLTLDTSHGTTCTSESYSAGISASTLQSHESLDSYKRVSQEATAEVEALRRKLSVARRAQAQHGGMKRERDELRDAADRSGKRILQLKDLMQKSKQSERALKNANVELETRLEAANNERLDVLEGFHDACEKVRELSHHLSARPQETGDVPAESFQRPRRQTLDAKLDDHHPRHRRAQSDFARLVPSDEPARGQLDRNIPPNGTITSPNAPTRWTGLTYSSSIDREGAIATGQPEPELSRCFEEISRCRMTIKKLRMNLKDANAELDVLRMHRRQNLPPTPDSGSAESLVSIASSQRKTQTPDTAPLLSQSDPGHDILPPPLPQTPTRTLASATSAALLRTTPELQYNARMTPSSEPKTPLAVHKRLPRPPSASGTPSPKPTHSVRLERAETLRSLSESIISSYANRNTTPEQQTVADGAPSWSRMASLPLVPRLPYSRFASAPIGLAIASGGPVY